ncbi:MAG: hypothetical protein KJ017_09915 [Alphaproteobacteria bacterium]|nr:hypothetical protein [Alphaproteobacteria bacterium]
MKKINASYPQLNLFPVRIFKRRNGYYYAHVTVPHSVRPIIQRTQIKKSLRTKNLGDAKILQIGVENALKYILTTAYDRPQSHITPQEIRDYLKDLASDLAFIRQERKRQISP